MTMKISLIIKKALVTISMIAKAKSSISRLFTIYRHCHIRTSSSRAPSTSSEEARAAAVDIPLTYRVPEKVDLAEEEDGRDQPLEDLRVLYRVVLLLLLKAVDHSVRYVKEDLEQGDEGQQEGAPTTEVPV